jgi:hypothetical protein
VLLPDLERLCASLDNVDTPYRKELCQLLSEAEIRALHNRVRHLLRSKRYPQPGPGPNYPWPPV